MADEHYLYALSAYGSEEFYPMDGATTNPFKLQVNEGYEEITVTPGDYVLNHTYWDEDPYVLDATYMPLYVYTANNEWKYVGSASDDYVGDSVGCNWYNSSGVDVKLDEGDGSFVEGSTCNRVILSPKQGQTGFNKTYQNSNHRYATYGYQYDPVETINETITIEVNYGDNYTEFINDTINEWWYQYPGVWVKGKYPDFNVPIPEPKYKGHVQLKWTDPPDITDWKPTPATWEGTVIVRKENSAPLHRWDGDKVVRTTTRDKYKSKPYKDEDIETNKVYYYAFMPYYTKIDDPQHPIRYYTFTKCIRVETGTISYIPEIIKIDMNEDVATITYAITLPATGPYDTAKLYGKKDGNPACDNTDDIVLDISQVDDQVVVPDIDGDYYFCIQVTNGTDTFTSDVVSCSGEGENPDPDYETLYSQINVWNIIHTPNWSIIVPDVWVAPTQNDYTGRYFVWDTNDRLNHSYYRANAEPGQWSICSTNQDVYSLSNVITINIDKDNNDKYVVILPTLTWSNDVFKNSYQYPGSKYYGWRMDYNGSTIRAVGWYASSTPSVSSPNPFNTLYDALYWTVAKFKHFTLYVDGTLWVRAN